MATWDWRETARDGDGSVVQWEAWTGRGSRAVIGRSDGYAWTVARDPHDGGAGDYSEATGTAATLVAAQAACVQTDAMV